MALKGEGDPRWVVKERQDGRNVNGWHWEDKDVTNWAEKRLKELINSKNCNHNEPSPGVHVLSVDTVEGDATLYNRKGVLKVLYDLKISGKWSSIEQKESFKKINKKNNNKDKDDKEQKKLDEEKNNIANGEFKIELFDDDPDIIVSNDNKCIAKNLSMFKSSFIKNICPKITKQCQMFIKELHEGADQFIDGLTLPKPKLSNQKLGQSITKSRTEVSSSSNNNNNNSSSKNSKSSSKQTSEISMTELFFCSKSDWISALTDQGRLSAITRNKAIVDTNKGGKWEILNGMASGEIISVNPENEFVMKWKLSTWAAKKGDPIDFGMVHANVVDKDGKTEATIKVSGIPKGKESETEGFWRIQILQAMRFVMGWGDASKFAAM